MGISQRLAYFPAALFGMIMGMTGLGVALLQGLHVTADDVPLALEIYLVVVALLMVVLFGAYAYKVLNFLPEVKAELKHPIKMNFVPAMSISLILMSIVTWHIGWEVQSFWLWSVGAVVHISLTYWVLYNWVHHDFFLIEHSNPAWFIPIVGNILVPIAGVHHAHMDINMFYFTVGLVFWIFLKAILFNRVIFHPPLPQRLMPTLFIFIAPPAVGFLSYLAINGGQLDVFAKILFFFAIAMTVLMLVSVKKFLALEFALSWWAFTFPIAAMAIASFKYASLSGLAFYQGFGWALTALLVGLVLLFGMRTLKAAIAGKICVDH